MLIGVGASFGSIGLLGCGGLLYLLIKMPLEKLPPKCCCLRRIFARQSGGAVGVEPDDEAAAQEAGQGGAAPSAEA